MFKITILLALFGIVLTQSACASNPVEDLPAGVWESETPYILLHINPLRDGVQNPLGIYRLDGEEIKVIVFWDPRKGGTFGIFDVQTLGGGIRVEYRLFDGVYQIIDENRFRITGRCEITGGRMEIMFYRVEGHDPIDARDWGYPWRRD